MALGTFLFGAGLIVLLAYHQRFIYHLIMAIFWAAYAVFGCILGYLRRRIEQEKKLDAEQRKKIDSKLRLAVWLSSIIGAGGSIVYAYQALCDLSNT